MNAAGVGLMSAEVSAKPAAAMPAAAPSSGGGGSIDGLCLWGLLGVVAAGFSRRARGVAHGLQRGLRRYKIINLRIQTNNRLVSSLAH